jgi:hypothetical protein
MNFALAHSNCGKISRSVRSETTESGFGQTDRPSPVSPCPRPPRARAQCGGFRSPWPRPRRSPPPYRRRYPPAAAGRAECHRPWPGLDRPSPVPGSSSVQTWQTPPASETSPFPTAFRCPTISAQKNRPRFPEARSHTARGVHPAALPLSLNIATPYAPVNRWINRLQPIADHRNNQVTACRSAGCSFRTSSLIDTA